MNDASRTVASSLIVALGIAAGGWAIGRGFVGARMADRYVTVKGISEQQVKANLALWPMRVVTTDNDLSRAQQTMAEQMRKVREFLTRHGLDGAGAELHRLEVSDANANQYGDATRVKDRYVVHQTLMVRSDQPDKVMEVSQQAGELVSAGIVLTSEEEAGPTFLFTKLSELKPPMVAEATARAREAAAKFAQDSHSKLGGIRQANQGLFEILPRDPVANSQESAQVFKLVRVVATVEYYLQD